jgi:hypothetical protein
MPLTKGFTRCNDLPEIQWRNQGETGGRHYEKLLHPPQTKLEKPRQTGTGALWKTKCPPCFWMKNMLYKATSTYTANFWQVIPWGAGVVGGGFLLHLSIRVLVKSPKKKLYIYIYVYIYIPQNYDH